MSPKRAVITGSGENESVEGRKFLGVGVRWGSSALGSVNVTMLAYPKNFEGWITILGESRTVSIGQRDPTVALCAQSFGGQGHKPGQLYTGSAIRSIMKM